MIYVFGNEYLAEDNMAVRVANYLSVEVKHCRGPEELLEAEGTITILDVVQNTTEVIEITNINDIKTRNILSLHDFDVGFFLHLLQELDIAKQIRIIGVPPIGEEKLLAKEVQLLL